MPQERQIMLKFFKRAEVSSPQSLNEVFKREQQQKNEIAKRLVQDFPWLWAIKNYHSWEDGEYTKVNQDMADLKTVLALPSKKTSFSMWTITSQVCQTFNMRATCLNPLDDKMWAEAVMQQTVYFSSIFYLVKVTSSSEYLKHITIFRHPGKIPLNELIEEVVQLHGGSARWQTPACVE